MRAISVALGLVTILAYAILGALLMTHWEVTAASGLPLDETIDALREAGQTYSTAAGIVFAAIGALLGLAWAAVSLAATSRPIGNDALVNGLR